MAASARLRLFIGLWPDDHTREAIAARADAWSWPASARRTPTERLHVTLHFLGPVAEDRVAPLIEGLQVRWDGCTLDLDRAAVWPGGIAVLEATRVPSPLAGLHRALADRLPGLGLTVDPRPWRPHVTLARQASGARAPAGSGALRWHAGPQVLLVQSLPGGTGYVPLARLS